MTKKSKKSIKRIVSVENLLKPNKFELPLIILFNLIFIGVPISIQLWQGYDDALFIRHAINIRNGDWLGSYNELTLVKGPGYPLFLALSNLLNMNIVLAQSLFWSISLLLFFNLVAQKLRNRFLITAMFAICLFDPRVFLLDHPIRETIYTSQAILSVSLLILVLREIHLLKIRRIRNLGISFCGGIIFGWFWLTREEGYWIVPSLLILAIYYGFRAKKSRVIGAFFKSSSSYAFGFVVANLIFCAVNLNYYGSFTGVDITESNFTAAISSLESIDSGPAIQFVSVTKISRSAAYEISPSFKKLKDYLDPKDSTSQWENVLCSSRSSTCGEIPNGFFVFAFRQAAAKVDAYSSPKAAKEFYGNIRDEISNACKQKTIICLDRSSALPLLPPMSDRSIDSIPGKFQSALHLIVGSGYVPSISRGEITGDKTQFESVLSFLGRPSHFDLNQGDKVPDSNVVQFSESTRSLLVKVYKVFIPLVFVFGFFSLIFFGLRFKKREEVEFEFLIIGASFIFAAAIRTLLVVLIDASSFPAIHDGYLNASFSFSLIGFSVWSLLGLTWLAKSRLIERLSGRILRFAHIERLYK